MSGNSTSAGGWGAAFILVTMVTGVALGACSMGPHYPSVDQSKGGIRARIMAVLTTEQVVQAAPACTGVTAVASAGIWVKAEFRRDRMRSAVIALAPSDSAVHLNDQVELQPEFCGNEKLFHVVQVLRGQVSAPEQSPTP